MKCLDYNMTKDQLLKEIVNISGDSTLMDITYNAGVWSIKLYIDELDKVACINITTNSAKVSSLVLSKEEVFKTCRIEIIKINDVLNATNGILVPASNFGTFMKETREGFSLAYGLKKKCELLLFKLAGYENLMICLVNSIDDINVKFLNHK